MFISTYLHPFTESNWTKKTKSKYGKDVISSILPSEEIYQGKQNITIPEA